MDKKFKVSRLSNKFKKQIFSSHSAFIIWLLSDNPMSGYQIVKIVRDDGMSIGYAQVYPFLDLMKQKGLLTCREKYTGKRKKKIYSVTKKGMRLLNFFKQEMITPLKKRYLKFLLGIDGDG